MSIFSYFVSEPKETANIAKERLQIIVAHERGQRNQPSYLPELRKELLKVINRFIQVDQDDVEVKVDQNDGCSVLELNVTLPSS